MKLFRRRGRLLRLRPGPLANFSGGAGYLPFIVIFTVPASFVYLVVSFLLLQAGTERSLRRADRKGSVPLHEFVRYARLHLVVCAALAGGLGIVFYNMAQRMTYGVKADYIIPALLLGVGPPCAAFASTLLLIWLIYYRGIRDSNLPKAIGVYVLLVFLLVLLAFPFL